MSEINIEQAVKEILAKQLTIDVNTIKLSSTLVEDLNIDSFGAVEMAFAIEDKFGFKVADEAVYGAKTVEDIVKYVTAQTIKK